jgi:hypothetical protein
MERRRIAWLLSLALMAVGGLFAHMLAYYLVAPHHHVRGQMLEGTGHSYFEHWPVCVSVCAVVVGVALLASVAARVRGGRPLRVPVWLFALVPPLGFTAQEHLERLLHTGAFPHAAALEPTFAVGLLLQIPFALAAFLIARTLLALAVALVETLRAQPRPALVSLDLELRPPIVASPARASALALGYGQRAPPVRAS